MFRKNAHGSRGLSACWFISACPESSESAQYEQYEPWSHREFYGAATKWAMGPGRQDTLSPSRLEQTGKWTLVQVYIMVQILMFPGPTLLDFLFWIT